jgi:release factor glutamine methyltransferase
MTIREVLPRSAKQIEKAAGSWQLAWAEAELLLATVLKKDRVWLVAHNETSLTLSQKKALDRLIKRRAKHEPIAYLTGSKSFYGRDFAVTKHVLVPRPETEELVEHVLLSTPTPELIWDVGTGSGAIAVTLKAECPKATVFASDVDARALAIAKRNTKTILKKSSAIHFFKGSLLTPQIEKAILKQKPKHLTIVANLPYLPLSDKKVLAKDVVSFEPSKALFTKDEGLFLIQELLRQLAVWLKKENIAASIWCEFDPPQSKVLKHFAQQLFPAATVAIHQDGCGRDRILVIQKEAGGR